jgi:hypothetical protein
VEKKVYYLGYNRLTSNAIVYSTAGHAAKSGTWWKEIEAHTLEQAKKEFLQQYHNEHTEHE